MSMKGVLSSPALLIAVIYCFLNTNAYTATTNSDCVYFSSLETIQVFFNNTTAVIFEENRYSIGRVSCNPTSRLLYWVDLQEDGNDVIRRGDPDNPQSVETIVSHDLTEPFGIAVDWAGNNIYFSQYLGAPSLGSRIEVISADGRHRKVLFDGIDGDHIPVAIDIIRGHLFYAEGGERIYRSDLDGSNRILMIEFFLADSIEALSVDIVQNVLYWVQRTNMINAFPMDRFTGEVVFFDDTNPSPPFVNLQNSARIRDVFAFNGTIHWTRSLDVGRGSDGEREVRANGSLVRSTLLDGGIGPLLTLKTGTDVSPEGVCTFFDMSVMNSAMSSPCYNSTVCGNALCFTVPDGSGSTNHSCGCSTGLTLNEDGRSCTSIPENFVIFTLPHYRPSDVPDRSDIRLISINEGDNPRFVDLLLPIEVEGTEVFFVAYDVPNHKVYWTETHPPAIKRANLDGTNQEIFINSSLAFPQALAIDPYSENIFWADSYLDIVSVASLSDPRKDRRVLYNNTRRPQGLAIDIARGLMYWTDIDDTVPEVVKAYMNGEGRQCISDSREFINVPTNVAVDPATGTVYWSDRVSFSTTIIRYTLEGQRTTLPVSRTILDAFGLAVNRDYLYFVDRASSRHSIGRINKTIGGTIETVHDGRLGLYGLVAVDTTTPDDAADVCARRCSNLCLPSHNRSEATCACPEHMVLSGSSCNDPVPIFLVSNITSSSNSSGLDFLDVGDRDIGSDPLVINKKGLLISPGVRIGAMDIDIRENYSYFIDTVKKVIMRLNLSPNNEDVSSVIINCCLESPEDLAVDWLGRNLYWTDSQRRVIEVALLTGQGRRVIAVVNSTLGPPGKIALDPFGGFIYWSSKSEPKIYATRMDGSQSSHWLITEYLNTPPATIFAISLSFMEWTTRVYWGVRTSSNESMPVQYKVIRSEVPSILPYHGSYGPNREIYIRTVAIYDLKVSVGGEDSDIIVVNEINRVNRANRVLRQIDGTELMQSNGDDVFAESAYSLENFVISHHSIQPGHHLCQVHMCSGVTLCLVRNGTYGSCQCAPERFRRSDAIELGDDDIDPFQATCVSTPNFLILGTESFLQYLPVPPGRHIGQVEPLPVVPQGRIVDMTYDPRTHRVLWMEEGSDVLKSLDLDDDLEIDVSLSDLQNLNPQSLTYDWVGGHVVFTDTRDFQLFITNTTGGGRGTLLDLTSPRSDVQFVEKPGEVVFDSKASTLYWTVLDILTGLGTSIKYMHLSDIRTISTIELTNRQINNLTFEPFSRGLYWMSYESGDTKIQVYDISTGRVSTVVENAGGVEAIAASSVEENDNITVYVYWYNRTDQYLYRAYQINETHFAPERYVEWLTSERVLSIVAQRQEENRVEHECSSPERPCSHICLPTGADHTCYCPINSRPDSNNMATCEDHSCGELSLPCGEDFGECVYATYYCDGIQHCRNGFDEQCPCERSMQRGCFNTSTCISHSQFCDGHRDCDYGDDEPISCCDPALGYLGCFVNDSAYDYPVYLCLEPDDPMKCNGVVDCNDGMDETDCATPDIPTETEQKASASVAIIISAVIISVLFVVVAVTIAMYVMCMFWRKRDEYRVGHHISYRHSPNLRTESTSDYCNGSEISHGTNITQINGSHTLSPGMEKMVAADIMAQAMMNPPPSPISTIQLQQRHSPLMLSEGEDGMSTISHGFSEFNTPAPPCPSLNYDNLSGNMSFSVSQTHFPATINASNNNYHYQYPQQGGVGGGRAAGEAGGQAGPPGVGQRGPGRNMNPLFARNPPQQQFGNGTGSGVGGGSVGGGGGGGGGGGHMYPLRAIPGSSTNHVPYANYHHHSHAHPDITESIEGSETDSTVSNTSENQDTFPYDTSMPHPPPGRPPSPATVYSEYPTISHRSPRSSTASYASEV